MKHAGQRNGDKRLVNSGREIAGFTDFQFAKKDFIL